MLEEFEKSTQKDTSVVQWQGFNEDGKLTVKDGDLSPVVKGAGQKYPNNNSKLILDTAGSVEQRKSSKKKRAITNRPLDVQYKPVPKTPFVARDVTAFITQEGLLDSSGGFGGVSQVGDYIIAYRAILGYGAASFTEAFGYEVDDSNDGDYTYTLSNIDRSYISKSFCNNYNCEPDTIYPVNASPDDIFSVILVAASGVILDFGQTYSLLPYVSVTVGGNTVSFQHTAGAFFGYGSYYVNNVIFGKKYSTDCTVSLGGVAAAGWGDVETVIKTASVFLANNAKYYYTFSSGESTVTRTINLSSIVTGDIITHEKIHEYRTREISGNIEVVLVYSVFAVVVMDTENEYEDVVDPNDINEPILGGIGKFTPYFVHTKLNLTTGSLNKKITQASLNADVTWTGIDMVNNTTGLSSRIPSSNYDDLSAQFPFGAFIIYDLNYVTSQMGHMQRIVQYMGDADDVWQMVDPSPIFTKAYEGDWISQFIWDSTDFISTQYNRTDWGRLVNFIKLSYYHGTFYGYKNAPLVLYPEVGPDCYDPLINQTVKGEYYYGDLPSTFNITEMNTIRDVNMPNESYADALYITNNTTGWGTYYGTRKQGALNDTNPVRITKSYGPLFEIDVREIVGTFCYEVGNRSETFLDLLAKDNLDYILNDPVGYDTVPLERYKVINGEVQFITKFAHNFAVGDVVSISGTEYVDGTFTISESGGNSSFVVSVTAEDTDSFISTSGTAAKV